MVDIPLITVIVIPAALEVILLMIVMLHLVIQVAIVSPVVILALIDTQGLVLVTALVPREVIVIRVGLVILEIVIKLAPGVTQGGPACIQEPKEAILVVQEVTPVDQWIAFLRV